MRSFAHPILSIAEPDLVWLRARARQARPDEACGLLLGRRHPDATEVVRVTDARNVAANPRTAFEIDPGAIVRATDLAAAEGLEPVGVWHSHPDRPAVLSAADRRALSADGSFLVLPARPTEPVRSWRRVDGRVVEEEVRVPRSEAPAHVP